MALNTMYMLDLKFKCEGEMPLNSRLKPVYTYPPDV